MSSRYMKLSYNGIWYMAQVGYRNNLPYLNMDWHSEKNDFKLNVQNAWIQLVDDIKFYADVFWYACHKADNYYQMEAIIKPQLEHTELIVEGYMRRCPKCDDFTKFIKLDYFVGQCTLCQTVYRMICGSVGEVIVQ